MGNSLRDELLKVGLVSQQRRENPRRSKRAKAGPGKKRKSTPSPSPSPSNGEQSVTSSPHVLRENQRRTARFLRDSTLAGGSLAESAKKALRRKIQELVQSKRLNHSRADVAYNFVKGKRIKRIYVTQAQRAELTAGDIVIAALDGDHHLLPRRAAEELLVLAPQTVICGGAEGDGGAGEADGDQHPVPDDLTW
jgi:uncharacterized protein YaiL (DUF2058 family)